MKKIKIGIIGLLSATMAIPALGQGIEPTVTVTPVRGHENQVTSAPQVVGETGVSDFAGNVRRPRNTDEQFLSAAGSETPDIALARPTPDLDRIIVQGTVIQAVMETRLISDLPGQLRGIVSYDIRSYDGSKVLIPKGSRIFGTYRSDGKINQERALILWSRVITPDGFSIMVGSPGVDRLGSAGQTGTVDKHFDERFGSAALISLVGAAPTVATAEATDESTADIVNDVGQNFQEATADVVSEYLSIEPTIYIDQGTTVNVMVARDLIFPIF